MANYAVRIYDEELKAWLIAEAARRGRGIRTSDVAEEALIAWRDQLLSGGSNAGSLDSDNAAGGRAGRRDGDHHAGKRRHGRRVQGARQGGDEGTREVGRDRRSGQVADAPDVQVPVEASGAVHGGDAPDRGAVDADVVARETVVQPVPAVDPERSMDDRIKEMNSLTLQVCDAAAEETLRQILTPVQRVKGPDSGPDEELGF